MIYSMRAFALNVLMEAAVRPSQAGYCAAGIVSTMESFEAMANGLDNIGEESLVSTEQRFEKDKRTARSQRGSAGQLKYLLEKWGLRLSRE